MDGISDRPGHTRYRAALPAETFTTRRGERTERGYRVVDGVAVISAMGGLVHRTRSAADSSLLIGYNDLAADLEMSWPRPMYTPLLWCWTALVASLRRVRTGRAHLRCPGASPSWPWPTGMAASAAYLAASAAMRWADPLRPT